MIYSSQTFCGRSYIDDCSTLIVHHTFVARFSFSCATILSDQRCTAFCLNIVLHSVLYEYDPIRPALHSVVGEYCLAQRSVWILSVWIAFIRVGSARTYMNTCCGRHCIAVISRTVASCRFLSSRFNEIVWSYLCGLGFILFGDDPCCMSMFTSRPPLQWSPTEQHQSVVVSSAVRDAVLKGWKESSYTGLEADSKIKCTVAGSQHGPRKGGKGLVMM